MEVGGFEPTNLRRPSALQAEGRIFRKWLIYKSFGFKAFC